MSDLRAEMKRNKKAKEKAKTATYNYTGDQLQAVITEALPGIMKEREEMYRNEAINTALLLTLTLPLQVLKTHYWPKTYVKKLPEFTDHLLELYDQYLNGDLDIEKLKKELEAETGYELAEGVLE